MDVLNTMLDLSERKLRDEVDAEFEGRCWLPVAGVKFTTEDVRALRTLQETRQCLTIATCPEARISGSSAA